MIKHALLLKNGFSNTVHATGTLNSEGEVCLDEKKKYNQEITNIIPTIPQAYDTINQQHRWSEPSGSSFHVRGLGYMRDRLKVASKETIMKVRGADFLLTDQFGPAQVAKMFPSILDGHLREKPTIIFNFRMPFGNLCIYFEIPIRFVDVLRYAYDPEAPTSSDDQRKLMNQFLSPEDIALASFFMGNNEYKNVRLKLIPRVIEGNILVRKLLQGKPVVIGNRLQVDYFYQACEPSKGLSEYLEIDFDTGSSSIFAQNIVSVCKRFMSSVTVDIGWLIECSSKETLPECILGSIRLHRLDPKLCPCLHVHTLNPKTQKRKP